MPRVKKSLLKGKKRFKAIQFELSEPIFKSRVTVVVNYPAEKFVRFLEDYSHPAAELPAPEFFDGLVSGVTLQIPNLEGEYCSVVWVKEFDGSPETVGVLCHEMTHATHQILSSKLISSAAENTEVVAYMQEFYFAEALRVLL